LAPDETKPVKIILLLITLPFVSAFAADQHLHRYTFEWGGSNYICVLSNANLADKSIWHEQEANPPLSVRTALQLATRYAANLLPESTNWIARDIILSHISDEVWIYEVQILPTRQDGYYMVTPIPLRVIVLMDGTVAPYKRTKSTPPASPH
jgi:hypothetical protein